MVSLILAQRCCCFEFWTRLVNLFEFRPVRLFIHPCLWNGCDPAPLLAKVSVFMIKPLGIGWDPPKNYDKYICIADGVYNTSEGWPSMCWATDHSRRWGLWPCFPIHRRENDSTWHKLVQNTQVAIMNYSLFFSSDASCSTSPGPNQSLSDSVIKRQAVTSTEKAGCGAVRGTKDDRKGPVFGLSALPGTPSLLLQVKYMECMEFLSCSNFLLPG